MIIRSQIYKNITQILKMGHFQTLFHLFSVLFKQTLQFFSTIKCEKSSIQYLPLGF